MANVSQVKTELRYTWLKLARAKRRPARSMPLLIATCVYATIQQRGVFRRAAGQARSTRTRQQWKPAFAVLDNCVSDSEAFVCLFVCLFCFVLFAKKAPRARPSCRPPRPSSCPPRPAQHSSTHTPRGRALRGVLQPRPGGAATLPLPEGRS